MAPGSSCKGGVMVLDRESGEIQHKIFKEIIDELNPEDCLVINDTKVIPARLHGAKEDTGAHIEVLLLKRKSDSVWETLVRPGKKARPGTRISFGDGLLVGEVIDVVDHSYFATFSSKMQNKHCALTCF